MDYQVVLTDTAKADASQIYSWVVERAPQRGAAWFDELISRLYTLERLPFRCPLAREAKTSRREIRCLLFGKRNHAYRILYEIDEPDRTVWILHIRHGALPELRPEQLSAVL